MADTSRRMNEWAEFMAGRVVNATPMDITVVAQIVQIRNIEVGEYRVRHGGNVMSAFSLDPLTVYRVGEEVYMLVPQKEVGDFSRKKLILGRAAWGAGTSFSDRHQMMNQWRRFGPNWLSPQWYWRNNAGTHRSDRRNQGIVALENIMEIPGTTGGITNVQTPAYRGYLFERPSTPVADWRDTPPRYPALTAAQIARMRFPRHVPLAPAADDPEGPEWDARAIPRATIDEIDRLFQNHSNVMERFMVEANFQTRFSNIHSVGEYGLLIECLVDNPLWDKETNAPLEGQPAFPETRPTHLVSYKMSCFDFNGNPYSMTVPTPQKAIFSFPRGALRGLVRVSLYQEDFVTDVVPYYDEGEYTVEDDGTTTWSRQPSLNWVPSEEGHENGDAEFQRTRNNISVTDVQIHFVEQINLNNRLFWLQIDTPNGTDIWDRDSRWWSPATQTPIPENPEALLRARLFYGSQELTDPETCTFYWYREKIDANGQHASGRSGVNDRDQFGRNWHDNLRGDGGQEGDGWAPIAWTLPGHPDYNNGNPVEPEWVGIAFRSGDPQTFGQWQPPDNGTNGTPNRNYVVPAFNNPPAGSFLYNGFRPTDLARRVEFNELRVPVDQVPWKWRYRVVVVYHGGTGDTTDNRDEVGRRGVLVTGDVTINNLGSPFDFTLPYPQTGMGMINSFLRVRNERHPWVEGPMFDEIIDPLDQRDWWARWWLSSLNGTNVIQGPRRSNRPEEAPIRAQYREGKIRINHLLHYNAMQFTAQVYAPVGGFAAFSALPGWINRAPGLPSTPFPAIPNTDPGSGWPPIPMPENRNDFVEIANVTRFLGQPDGLPFSLDIIGRTHFNFFANGKMKRESALNEVNSLQAKLTWNGPFIADYRTQWFMREFAPDGLSYNDIPLSDLPDTEHNSEAAGYHPERSMLYGLWSSTGEHTRNPNNLNVARFRVKNRLDRSLPNNTLVVKITFFDNPDDPYVRTVPISFTKDGDPGTNGREWSARIHPVNTVPAEDGVATNVMFHIRQKVRPLHLSGTLANPSAFPEVSGGRPTPRLVLRPFIEKLGRDIEDLPPIDGQRYRAEITWDVRYGGTGTWDRDNCDVIPAAGTMRGVVNRSFIRISGGGPLFGDPALTAETEFAPTATSAGYAGAAAEVTWGGGAGMDAGITFASVHHACVVRAKIDIYLGTTLLETIFDYHGVDLLVTPLSRPVDFRLIDTNWPSFVQYDAVGYNPEVLFETGDPLRLRYGRNRKNVENPLPVSARPQVLNSELASLITFNNVPREWHFDPVPYFIANAWFYSSIRTVMDAEATGACFSDWGDNTTIFLRPQIFRLMTHGNADINGWDGRVLVPGITDNWTPNRNGEGAILAPTVGAGWMHPHTNKFTGVLMGQNTALVRPAYRNLMGGFPGEARNSRVGKEYMIGLFGYQNGLSSFGLLENGIAYFGRADRGRIYIDGVNAQIYGGRMTNDVSDISSTDMLMANRMRLSFLDFHQPGNFNNAVPEEVEASAGSGYALTQSNTTPDAVMVHEQCSPIRIGTQPLTIPSALWQYFVWGAHGAGANQVNSARGFGRGPGFATPAIEIGQYSADTEHIVRELTVCEVRSRELAGRHRTLNTIDIPGRRRFLVTYDGTMYAMNAFIKGNVVGSNLIGSQFFNWDGSFAITQRGNLGIGIARDAAWGEARAGDWLSSAVVPGSFNNAWSNRIPFIRQRPVSEYIIEDSPGENGIRNRADFWGDCEDIDGHVTLGQGYNFFVTNQGRVIARDLHVQGGSLNIGSFYIVGSGTPNRAGDIVSFGTMFLVGVNTIPTSAEDASAASINRNAVEAWGNMYFRGKLTNLGAVFLGSAIEKRTGNGSFGPGSFPAPPSITVVSNSMNSPFSIVPNFDVSRAGEEPTHFEDLPTRMGMWPLYFHAGEREPQLIPVEPGDDDDDAATSLSLMSAADDDDDEYEEVNLNNTWVVLASNPAASPFGDNGFMPAFAHRASQELETSWTSRATATLPASVTWRVDQLGMWTDAILFTNRTWRPVADASPQTLDTDALIYMGWADSPSHWNGNPVIGTFLIKNRSRSARNIGIETNCLFRLSAGIADDFATDPARIWTRPTMLLEAWVPSAFAGTAPNGFPEGQRPGAFAISADNDMIVGKAGGHAFYACQPGRNTLEVQPLAQSQTIETYFALNGIGIDTSIEAAVRDELGRTVSPQPNVGFANTETAGRAMLKGVSFIADFVPPERAGGANTWITNHHSTTLFRINRTFTGDATTANSELPQSGTAAGARNPQGTNWWEFSMWVARHQGYAFHVQRRATTGAPGGAVTTGSQIPQFWIYTGSAGLSHTGDNRTGNIPGNDDARAMFFLGGASSDLRMSFGNSFSIARDWGVRPPGGTLRNGMSMDGTHFRLKHDTRVVIAVGLAGEQWSASAGRHLYMNQTFTRLGFSTTQHLRLQADEIRITGYTAEQQHGIFARFAPAATP